MRPVDVRTFLQDYALDPMGVLEQALAQQSQAGSFEQRLSPAARAAVAKLSPEARLRSTTYEEACVSPAPSVPA